MPPDSATPAAAQELSASTLHDCKVLQTADGKLSTDAAEPEQVLTQRPGGGAKVGDEDDDYEAEVRAALKKKEAAAAAAKAAAKGGKPEKKAGPTKQV